MKKPDRDDITEFSLYETLHNYPSAFKQFMWDLGKDSADLIGKFYVDKNNDLFNVLMGDWVFWNGQAWLVVE